MQFKVKVDGYKLSSEMLEVLNNGKGSEESNNKLINMILSDVLNRSYVLKYKVVYYQFQPSETELRLTFEAEVERV